MTVGQTGKIGDGKIFVLPLEECYRIPHRRERQRGDRAVAAFAPAYTSCGRPKSSSISGRSSSLKKTKT
jgi:hypothetical protein